MGYSIKEIIDIAVGFEEAGHDFYTRCIEKFKDENIREIFSFMAKEELNHKKTFKSMSKSNESSAGIFTDEYFLYIKAIGGGRVFGKEDIGQIADSINTPAEAVQKAFMDEKNSILFYSELKKMYREGSEEIKLLDEILEEERKHVITLVDIMEKMQLKSQ